MNVLKDTHYIVRKVDAFLMGWKASKHHPLIVKGARQVGKTRSIRHFAERYYNRCIEINFVERPEFKTIVENGFSVASILRGISAVDSTLVFDPGNTLVFFDEIQEFPEIATALKFFAEDGRFDVICSGSLLGVQYKRIASFSVGYQQTYTMRSLDFEEFLWAMGYTTAQIDEMFGFLVAAKAVPTAYCTSMERLFLDYCALGGMPEVVDTYLATRTFAGTEDVQRRLLDDLRADIRKYAEGLDAARIQSVFNSLPVQLAKENKKFVLAVVEKNARRKDFWGCVEWLSDAGVVNVCHKMHFPELPIRGNSDADFYKLYVADSGLLLAMTDRETRQDLLVRRNLGTWKGGFFENVVAEALVKAEADIVYYKRDNSSLEMDFFLRSQDDLVPVEVKAENTQGKSLNTLISSERYADIRWGVKLVHGNVGYEHHVLTLPQWSAFLLPRVLAERCGRQISQ